MKNKLSLFFVLVTVLVSTFAGVGAYIGKENHVFDNVDVKEMTVYVKGEPAWHGWCTKEHSPYENKWYCETYQLMSPALERGETLPIRVTFDVETTQEEVKVKAWINGYREDIEDQTELFDMYAGYTYTKYLYLDIPEDIGVDPNTDKYTLYVEIMDGVAFDGVARAEIDLQVQQISNTLEIKSVELYAGRDICGCYTEQILHGICGGCNIAFESGSTLYADVVVKNMGSQEQEDVFVKFSIEELCLERTVYVGDLKSGKAKEVTLYLVLPENVQGDYEVTVEAFNEYVEEEVKQTITIVKASQVSEVQIFFENTRKDVEQGKTAVYNLHVTNSDSTETFIVSVEGTAGWANAQVMPATFTLSENESETVSIRLNVNEEAIVAEHQFTVKVKYGNEIETFNLSANVTGTPSSTSDLQYLFLVIGIVLAVIIVVLLILLIAKNGGKGRVERPEEEYSYY